MAQTSHAVTDTLRFGNIYYQLIDIIILLWFLILCNVMIKYLKVSLRVININFLPTVLINT